MQLAMTGYPAIGYIFGTTQITFAMQMTSLGCGIGVWIVTFFTKLTSMNWFANFESDNSTKFVLIDQEKKY